MLKLINNLRFFFEDSYQRINVREYARLIRISPPNASKKLSELEKEGLLKKEVDKKYFYYSANRLNNVFIGLSRIYWYEIIMKSGLIEHLIKELLTPTIILFGSLSKAEVRKESDIDLAILTPSNKELNLKSFENKIGRSIQLFIFKNKDDIKSEELLNSILNGFIIRGRL
ncbi:MAG TPA: nucleotidyltransferase domain-containing protein [Candidatus Nanoarchaeia archaeon]|nr:nucleotidyltransferase domain-containing protein [Candidatus Nanoarchaeia archaeon]